MKTKESAQLYNLNSETTSGEWKRTYIPFLENIKDQVVITDADGTVQYANGATQEITGFLLHDILGKKAGKLWGGEMPREFYEKMWRTIKNEKKPFVGTVKNRRSDGSEYYAELRIYPVLDAYRREVCNFIGIEPDITERTQKEEKRNDFISLATHQLKTPLTTEQMILSILEHSGDNLTGEQKRLIETARELNTNLADCVRDLLLISQIEKKKDGIRDRFLQSPVSFASLLHKVIKEVDHLARKKNVHILLAYEEDIAIHLPENILRQIVVNVVMNAIAYSKPREDVCMAFRKEGDRLLFMCRDHGIGIPKEEQHEIFQPFFRASNAKKEREGTGLGLFIVKKLADELGCRVWFESFSSAEVSEKQPDHGTIFYFSVPFG